LCLPGPCPFGENVENQAGPVKDLDLDYLFEISKLSRCKFVIKKDKRYFLLFACLCYFLCFSRTDETRRVNGASFLDDALDFLSPGGFGEKGKLVKIFLGFMVREIGEADADKKAGRLRINPQN
jgi:hypothetical protein